MSTITTLIVVDDVWDSRQLAPFTSAARGNPAVRVLVTTRSTTLAAGGVRVTVDRVTPEQAQAILTRDLTGLTAATRDRLLKVTDGWPLILASINLQLRSSVIPVEQQARALLDRYLSGGPKALDELTDQLRGPSPAPVDDQDSRGWLASATIDAGRTQLEESLRPRVRELGIFAEDEHIPVDLVALLWSQTAGLDTSQTGIALSRMADVGLLYLHRGEQENSISLHDVYRDHVRHELAPTDPATPAFDHGPVDRIPNDEHPGDGIDDPDGLREVARLNRLLLSAAQAGHLIPPPPAGQPADAPGGAHAAGPSPREQ